VLEMDHPERANDFNPAATPWVIATDILWHKDKGNLEA